MAYCSAESEANCFASATSGTTGAPRALRALRLVARAVLHRRCTFPPRRAARARLRLARCRSAHLRPRRRPRPLPPMVRSAARRFHPPAAEPMCGPPPSPPARGPHIGSAAPRRRRRGSRPTLRVRRSLCRRTCLLTTVQPLKVHTLRVVSNKSVLVVDDDTSIRGMVRSVLHREGFDVEEVSGGNDAIARMAAKLYDAVVLDIMMRDGTGHDVLHVLASSRPAVKCVVVVSAASPAALDALPDANVQAKLRKPFDIHDLVSAVHRCVTREA